MKKNKQVGKNIKGDMIQDSVIVNVECTINYRENSTPNNLYDAIEMIKIKERELGVRHPRYPLYSTGLKRIGNDLVPYSQPLSNEAIEKYPPGIKSKISFADKYRKFNNLKDLLAYSYNTQTELEIDSIELTKMLGDEPDPHQDDIKHLLSSTTNWKLKPQEFPEARAFKVVIDEGKVSYDYILLRTTRIEDEVIYLSNKEQSIGVEFTFGFDVKNHKMSINIIFAQDMETNKKQFLKYLKFIKGILSKNKLSITDLESDTLLAEGIIDNFNYESLFGDIDNEITFIEYIILIENHYNSTIKIPDEILKGDLEALYYLGYALKFSEKRGKWENVTLELLKLAETEEHLKDYKEEPCRIAHVAPAKVMIFGEKYNIPKVIRIFENAQVDNLEKVKQQVEKLDEGEGFKMNFIAKGDNQYIEEYDFDA